MEFNLSETIAVLTRTPATLNSLLRGLPEGWTHSNEGAKTWSAFDILGHLNHCERADWMPRVQVILAESSDHVFEPLDRFAQEKTSQGKSIEQLLDELVMLRRENLAALEAMHLQPKDFARQGTHPQLGTVTLAQLLASWPVHDMTHLHQLSRIMAYQYREAVGPWSAFMGVMRCNGHSA